MCGVTNSTWPHKAYSDDFSTHLTIYPPSPRSLKPHIKITFPLFLILTQPLSTTRLLSLRLRQLGFGINSILIFSNHERYAWHNGVGRHRG